MTANEARLMYFTSESMTHKDISEALGMSEKSVVTAIRTCGIRQRDIIQRQKDKWLRVHRDTFTLDKDGSIERCVQCRIFMIDRPDIVPPDWAWEINGRLGDMCRACAKEMNSRHKRRMDGLSRIGCIVCRIERGVFSETEIHHLRDKLGIGQRRNHDRTIPLCPGHHRLGGRGTARHEGLAIWEMRHGAEIDLLDMVNTILEDTIKE